MTCVLAATFMRKGDCQCLGMISWLVPAYWSVQGLRGNLIVSGGQSYCLCDLESEPR